MQPYTVLYSVKEYAMLTNYSQRAIRYQIRRGQVSAFKQAGTWYIVDPDL
ncbi:MAG: helix-turn-helix domain-containing protein [Cyanothece sp. SIO1E1]|nr:helix-turn-helix domain-containing protein [Cyanothece sp. SIO1E1]